MIFLESPWPILILGLAVEAILAIALFRTGRSVLLAAMAGVAMLVLLGVLVERWTVTDTKRIGQTLEAAAAGLVAGKQENVAPWIVPDADGNPAREKVGWALSVAQFQEISIRNLEVKLNYHTSPPTADSTFTAWVRGRDRHDVYPGEISRPVAMEVKLRKEAGRWLIFGTPKHDVRE
jgi:hypothetical protein